MAKSQQALTVGDIAEIAIGSCVLAFPVATTEEIWNLSTELSTFRIVAIGLMSLFVVSLFVFVVYRHEGQHPSLRDFLHRVTAVYAVTILICAAILIMIDRLPLLTDLSITVKRTVLVAFPASFSATVVDSLGLKDASNSQS